MASTALWNSSLPAWLFDKRVSVNRFFVEGQGCRLRDSTGCWFLDGRASLWDASLGYGYPSVVEAIQRQVATLAVCQTVRHDRPSEVAIRFAETILKRLSDSFCKVRFGSTGSQIVDVAVLLSRATHRLNGDKERSWILALREGYHGMGGGPTALTEQETVCEWLGPLIGDVYQVDTPEDTGSLSGALISAAERLGRGRIAALIIEPILGNGMRVLAANELRELATFSQRNGIHLIVDEIATGWGRTGVWSRSVSLGVIPDILLFGKGLTSGYVPCSALVASPQIYRAFADRNCGRGFPVGSTADGHPLAMAAGLAVTTALDAGILSHVKTIGRYLRKCLSGIRHQSIQDIRGDGLMLGVRLWDRKHRPWSAHQLERFRVAMEQRRVLIHPTRSCVTIVPPLTIEEADCDEIATALTASLRQVEP